MQLTHNFDERAGFEKLNFPTLSQERLVHDKIIPKKTHWEETIWKGPMDLLAKQSSSLTSDIGNARQFKYLLLAVELFCT